MCGGDDKVATRGGAGMPPCGALGRLHLWRTSLGGEARSPFLIVDSFHAAKDAWEERREDVFTRRNKPSLSGHVIRTN